MAAIPQETMEVRVRKKVAKQLYDSLCVDNKDTPLFRQYGDGDKYSDDDPQAKRKGLKVKPQSPYTFQNFLWLVVAAAILYYTDFLRVLRYDTRIRPTWFVVGMALICVNVSIASFLIVYLSAIKKLSSDDWERMYPAAIPIATASFAFGSFCLTVALWPVWSVLTIPILFSIFMGVVIIIAMFK